MECISDVHDSASDADLDAPSQPDDLIKYTTCTYCDKYMGLSRLLPCDIIKCHGAETVNSEVTAH
jgi:hypothetical protein